MVAGQLLDLILELMGALCSHPDVLISQILETLFSDLIRVDPFHLGHRYRLIMLTLEQFRIDKLALRMQVVNVDVACSDLRVVQINSAR